MTAFRQGLVLSLVLVTVLAQAQPRVEVFELQHRQAVDIVTQLQALYSNQSAIFSTDQQRLMVKAEPPIIQEIANLVSRLDVAAAQMRVTLRRQQQSQGKQKGVISRTVSTRSGQSSQSVVIQDGETARIESGSIRRVTRAVQGGKTVALIAEDTPMTEGFLVQPRALGSNQVELRVVSFDNGTPRHRAGGSDREAAALVTVRRAMPGEWVPLGSTSDGHEAEHSGRVYSTRHASANNQSWSVKVEILQ